MKKSTLIIEIILTVAVAALFVLFFTSKKGSNRLVIPEGTEVTAQKGDIVYIQLDTLVNQYDMYNDLKSEFEVKFNSVQDDLSKKSRAFQNDATDFQNNVKKGLLTRSQAESLQNSLTSRQTELQQYSQKKQRDMQEEEQVMINKVMDSIHSYIKEYNKVHNYALIISTSNSMNVIMLGNPSLDITNDVLKGLNDAYIKNRNKK